MAIPNLAALFLLRRQVTAALSEYEGRVFAKDGKKGKKRA